MEARPVEACAMGCVKGVKTMLHQAARRERRYYEPNDIAAAKPRRAVLYSGRM